MPRVFLAQPSHQLLIARMFLKKADYFLELIQKNIDNQKLDMSEYVSMVGNFPLLSYYGIFALKYMVTSLQIIRCENLQIKNIISITDIKNLESNIESDKTINDVIDVNLFKGKLPEYPSYHDRKKDDPEKYLIKAKSWHEGLKNIFSRVENKLKEFAFSENEKEWIDYCSHWSCFDGEEINEHAEEDALDIIDEKFWEINEAEAWFFSM